MPTTSPLPLRPASLAALGNALRRRRESLHLTLDQLAHATGISKPYLSNIETARAPGPASPEKLKKIARALDLPPGSLLAAADWLRTPPSVRQLLQQSAADAPVGPPPSEQDQSPSGTSTFTIQNAPPRRPDGTIDLDTILKNPAPPTQDSPPPDSLRPLRTAPLPLINRVAAGHPAEHTDLDYPAGIADNYIHAPDIPGQPPAAFALRIQGDSMAPEYREGDIIILAAPTDPAGRSTIHDGDDCVIRLADDANFATTFKRIYHIHDGRGAGEATNPATSPTALRLVPLNPAYPERIVPLEQVTGIYPLLYRLIPAKRSSQ